MTRIVLMSGSLRRGSVNSTAVATIGRLLARRGAQVHTPLLDLRTLPYYDQDLDAADGPATVARARRLLESADALVISTPSYNGGAPGVLKNALDWLSRPWGDSALTGLPTALMSASPGPRGAADAQPGLRVNLERSGAVLIDHRPLALGDAEALPRTDQGFTDPSVLVLLEELADSVWAARRGAADAEVIRPPAGDGGLHPAAVA
ncbi:NADPH-dependent FMN reductase [Streptomyces sp. NPDC094149]|uniref:NADPH-dependent FMN reductase n=1 Tax=Streptomyces sp. NPDC094149 TaxID=3155079 RepID=UPI00333203A1